jgi:hypothetical protein
MSTQETTIEPLPHEWLSYSAYIGEAQCDVCGKHAYGRALSEPCRWWDGRRVVWKKPSEMEAA